MKPTKPITDPSFVYRNSASTDIAATFRRIRREMAKQEAAMNTPEPVKLPGNRTVVALTLKKRKA
jgi:hypothetical protein